MKDIAPDNLTLQIYPAPVLSRRADEVVFPLPDNFPAIFERMAEIMYDHNGVGLAGPQADLPFRVLVYDLSEERDQPLVLINPEILESDGNMDFEEGCLSFPDIRATVKRAAKIKVSARDENNREVIIESDDELTCAMLQHEIDHLNGITFIERLRPMEKMRIRADLKELESAF